MSIRTIYRFVLQPNVRVFLPALALLGCPGGDEDKGKTAATRTAATKTAATKTTETKTAADKAPTEKTAAEQDLSSPPQPSAASPAAANAGCTVDYIGQTVDGSTLWSDIPNAENPQNCNFQRFAYNNFLYLVGGTDPRFLTDLASTTILAKTHDWPTTDAIRPLTLREIDNVDSLNTEGLTAGEAGDDFNLVDVANNTVMYDIRINKTMWDSIKANNWDTKDGQKSATKAFRTNDQTGGIWLPPNTGDGTNINNPSADDSIEMKTSWRNYGANASDCPSAIMYCIQGTDGNTYGLLGMHLVQKTPTRGEWVWASFEHVGNAPDCDPQGSNPLQQDPRDPTNPTTTINVNQGSLASQTGWTSFNYSTYSSQGGNGKICDYPRGIPTSGPCKEPSGTSQCNGNPNPSGDGKTFVQVNICRTDAIPDHSTPPTIANVCASNNPTGSDPTANGNNIACITQSVLDNWPSGLANHWKYYMLVGAEWLDAPRVQTVGCFGITNTANPNPGDNYSCPKQENSPQTYKTTGSINLSNTTMETWMQMGTCFNYTPAKKKTTSVGATDCFACHQPATFPGLGDLSHTFFTFQ